MPGGSPPALGGPSIRGIHLFYTTAFPFFQGYSIHEHLYGINLIVSNARDDACIAKALLNYTENECVRRSGGQATNQHAHS